MYPNLINKRQWRNIFINLTKSRFHFLNCQHFHFMIDIFPVFLVHHFRLHVHRCWEMLLVWLSEVLTSKNQVSALVWVAMQLLIQSTFYLFLCEIIREFFRLSPNPLQSCKMNIFTAAALLLFAMLTTANLRKSTELVTMVSWHSLHPQTSHPC